MARTGGMRGGGDAWACAKHYAGAAPVLCCVTESNERRVAKALVLAREWRAIEWAEFRRLFWRELQAAFSTTNHTLIKTDRIFGCWNFESVTVQRMRSLGVGNGIG